MVQWWESIEEKGKVDDHGGLWTRYQALPLLPLVSQTLHKSLGGAMLSGRAGIEFLALMLEGG